ncbi:MAG: hypothetical protein Q8T11_09410 [Elusimicrobiota bacterium]|nr:hypothetical protein [Elusimicrobiota bacterium]
MSTPFHPALFFTAMILMTACGEEPISRARVPKTDEPPALAVAPRDMSSSGPGLRWSMPKGWKEVPGTGMRLATFVPPGGLKTEGTVVSLPGDSGSELANANRWRGQIGLPPTDEAGMAAARTTVAAKIGPVRVYDFTSEGEARTRLIAAVVSTGDTTWFFKLMGEAGATESARPGFLAIIKGLDAAK